ncbi:S8 family peptidase [Bacillus norwichensis]|uniref:S8 family serine peptidase n=1 Tax=Bacillus norwichensis TaxID=2762217 RepID=A0ABR8VL24_9BACI|nr:S8 family serine peptidase [Bacillus norwichensis]MBD8005437.1 S8 family serine peptidase [Bacillus norwichensis]
MKKLFAVIAVVILLLSFPLSVGHAEVSGPKEQHYSVLFNKKAVPSEFEQQIKTLGGEVTYTVPEIGFAEVKVPSKAFSKLKGISGVSAANPSIKWNIPMAHKIEASHVNPDNAALWDKQWDIQRITHNGESYKLGTGSHDVVVGIIDTGIDRNHPDLVKNLMPGSKNFVPVGGYQGAEPYENGDPNAFDDFHGHGSHVAGSIAANGAMLGVAPDVGIRSYRVFGTSSAETSWIIAAMVAAANDGVDVISMSLGGFDVKGQIFYVDPETGKKENLGNDVADFNAYKRAVEYATSKGSLVVVAAGNESLNATNKKTVLDYINLELAEYGLYAVGAGFEVPGIIPGVVTVSATGPKDVLANYSNYGPGFIDVAAVGGDARMYDQYEAEGRLDEYISYGLFEQEFNLSTSQDGGYYWSIGTSMAAPKVSAVAALLIDKHGKMTPKKLEDLLYKTAVDPVKGTDKKNFGNGHLNAYKALR